MDASQCGHVTGSQTKLTLEFRIGVLMQVVGLLVFTLSASLALADTSLRLYHRIWDPLSPPPSFSVRAHLQLSPEFGPILVLPQDSTELLLSPDHGKGTLYQIALEREGDLSETDWDLSSMKAVRVLFEAIGGAIFYTAVPPYTSRVGHHQLALFIARQTICIGLFRVSHPT